MLVQTFLSSFNLLLFQPSQSYMIKTKQNLISYFVDKMWLNYFTCFEVLWIVSPSVCADAVGLGLFCSAECVVTALHTLARL